MTSFSFLTRQIDDGAMRLTRQRGFLEGVHLDLPLLVALLLLAGLGLAVLYGASGQNPDLILRQAVRLLIAFAGMAALAQISPHHLRYLTPWLYGLGLLLLVTVLGIGQISKGAQRWLDLGLFRFQPSEMMKVCVPMTLAWYLAERRLPPSWGRVLLAGLMVLAPVALTAKQPDLGTALLIAVAGVCVLFLAGVTWRLIIALGVLLATLTPVMWYLMHDYQRARVLTFLNPENDPLGAGYHIIQSKIAIGAGGLVGKGWLNGTQSQLDFLPERSTDFIFAVLGEEFGLAGILLLFSVYLFVIMRGLYIAVHAQDSFARLLGGGITLMFFVYIIVNTGMVTGMLPVVGVPLPLISYGGTSMVTLMAGFGILMSIHTHWRLFEPERG